MLFVPNRVRILEYDLEHDLMANEKTTLGFQTEVKQLLHLMIHSLYSNKEIFLRELISNASDANDRLRFAAVSDGSLLEDQADLEIRIETDLEAGTISITDTGIGDGGFSQINRRGFLYGLCSRDSIEGAEWE